MHKIGKKKVGETAEGAFSVKSFQNVGHWQKSRVISETGWDMSACISEQIHWVTNRAEISSTTIKKEKKM